MSLVLVASGRTSTLAGSLLDLLRVGDEEAEDVLLRGLVVSGIVMDGLISEC